MSRQIHLLKTKGNYYNDYVWCGIPADLTLDTELVENADCKYCTNKYKTTLLEEHNTWRNRELLQNPLKKNPLKNS